MQITGSKVAALTCPPGRKDILVFDDKIPGYGVRVSATGSKIFIAQYNIGTVRRRMPIGRFGKDQNQFTEPKAREKALAILGAVKAGRDPYAEREAQIAEAEANEVAKKVKSKTDAFTVDALIKFWSEDRERAGRKDGYLRIATAALRRGLEDDLSRPAIELTEDEAEQRITEIEEASGPIAANRLLSYARAAYARAVRSRKLDFNPFARTDPPAAEESRDRVLGDKELLAIWHAAAPLPPPYGAWARMLILTGQRRSEVAGMRWSELSEDTWLIPGGKAGRAKNRLAHLVHITEPMREILDEVVKRSDAVFPGERGSPICAFSFAKRAIDATAKVQEWRWHDLRRTQQTWLVKAGFNSDVVDRIANHREGKARGVKGIYQRYEYVEERKVALEAWCKHVMALAEGHEPTSNVVPMAAGRRT